MIFFFSPLFVVTYDTFTAFFSFTQERRCFIYQSSQFEIEADLILASFLEMAIVVCVIVCLVVYVWYTVIPLLEGGVLNNL